MPEALVRALAAAADAVGAAAGELNRLDGFAGDGDLGITMTEAAGAVKDVLAGAAGKTPAEVLSACGAAIAGRAPSTSGTLVATGFLRAAKALAGSPGTASGPSGGTGASAGPQDATAALAACFSAALAGVGARGKASVGDRTLVDGLDAVCASLELSARQARPWEEALAAAADAARRAAEATASMEPKVGRASWVPQRALGHPDAGCTMLALALKGSALLGQGPALLGEGPGPVGEGSGPVGMDDVVKPSEES